MHGSSSPSGMHVHATCMGPPTASPQAMIQRMYVVCQLSCSIDWYRWWELVRIIAEYAESGTKAPGLDGMHRLLGKDNRKALSLPHFRSMKTSGIARRIYGRLHTWKCENY